LRHPDQFPSTQPTQTNAISLAPSVPTTRPFEDAKQDVLARIINPEVDKRIEAIQSRIVAALGADWMAYHFATPSGATRPTTAPVSSVGVSYDSFDYLQKLAAAVQKEFA